MTVTHSDSLGRPGNSSMIAAWCTRCKVLKDTESDNEIWKWTTFEVWNLLIWQWFSQAASSLLAGVRSWQTSISSELSICESSSFRRRRTKIWFVRVAFSGAAPSIWADWTESVLVLIQGRRNCNIFFLRMIQDDPSESSKFLNSLEFLKILLNSLKFLKMIQDDPSESISPGSLIATLHPIASSLGPKWARSGYGSGCNMM